MTSSPSMVLITGAGSGIGRELARTFAREGCAIAAVDQNEEGLRSLANEMQAQGRSFDWMIADVTEAYPLQLAVQTIEKELGPTDVLIANAGIGIQTTGLNYNTADMNKVIGVNLIGVSNSIGAVLPGMVERKRGHIVAMSSMASYRGLPGMLAYCASKAGVNAIMDGLRVELEPLGIHVTTICPGWIRTPMTAHLHGTLDDIIELDAAVAEIAQAIRRKRPFFAFPRRARWRMRFLAAMPLAWQDHWIRQVFKKIKGPG